jgi:hypothetical protein
MGTPVSVSGARVWVGLLALGCGLGAGYVLGSHDLRGVSMLDVFPLTVALIPFAVEFVLVFALGRLADHGSGGWVVAAVVLMVAMGAGMAALAHWEVNCGAMGRCGVGGYPQGEAARTALVAGLAWASQAGLMAVFSGEEFSEEAGGWIGSCVAVVAALIGGIALSRVHI